MSDLAIRVENLGKRYKIGARVRQHDTLRDALMARVGRRTEDRGRKTDSRPSSPVPGQADTIWALKDVSFEVRRGEVVGIIGRNGAGKSTLLKILSRITEPTEGGADIYGRVGTLLEVGTGFHPELTGRENIFLSGAILGMRKAEIERRFDEIVAFAEIDKFIDTPVKRYSSGMYVRLAFAVAAHLEPEILLVDEVLAVGDAAFQKKCLGKMGDVAKEGRTVLFVSHQMNAIEQLCSRAILIQEGAMTYNDQNVRYVIERYLLATQVRQGEWTSSEHGLANEWFQPTRFLISDKSGKVISDAVRNDEEFWIQIEGNLYRNDPALTIGYAVYAADGTLLYWSYQTDEKEDYWPKTRKGFVVLRSQFPRRFLNEGEYRIELIGGLHFKRWLFQPRGNVPSISLKIQGGLSDSPNWMSQRPGLLAPVLKWTGSNEGS